MLSAVTCLLVVSGSSAKASIIVDSYNQYVGQLGFYPSGNATATSSTTVPLSVSSDSGHADITSSTATASGFSMNYSLGIAVDTYGYAYAEQIVSFHVDSDAAYTFNISPTAAPSTDSANYGYLYSLAYGFEFDHTTTDGSGFSESGVLHSGVEYNYTTYAEPLVDYLLGPTSFETTGSSSLSATSSVPEPSSFALLGLGGIGLAIGAYRRRTAAT